MAQPRGYSHEGATLYHYGAFPPRRLDYEQILPSLTRATEDLARYDAMLMALHNKELLLAPLRSKEAVISSRIEGTVATLEEVLKIQADADDEDAPQDRGSDAFEVFCYTQAMRYAQKEMDGGLPICARLIRGMHESLLRYGRGYDTTPGEFKTDQNFVVDKAKRKVLFIPIESGEALDIGIHKLEDFINNEPIDYLIQTALAHLEFEALHPFKDGNGRVGRMLITLNLWDKKKISSPHFYISDYLEQNREEYIDRLRAVSDQGKWTEWVIFFLEAISSQSRHNTELSERIIRLYEEMKDVFRKTLASQWSINALDFIFERGIFRNSSFTKNSGIPQQTAHRITSQLRDAGLLFLVAPASGRRSALYGFGPLLDIVQV